MSLRGMMMRMRMRMNEFSQVEAIVIRESWNPTLKKYIRSASEMDIETQRRLQDIPVNPEGIETNDIISTTNGIAECAWVDNEKGTLSYFPLGSTSITGRDIPIRHCRLLSKRKNPQQMEFPFIQEMIDRALQERNEELKKLQVETFVKANPTKVKKIGKTEIDMALEKLISQLTPQQIAKLL